MVRTISWPEGVSGLDWPARYLEQVFVCGDHMQWSVNTRASHLVHLWRLPRVGEERAGAGMDGAGHDC